MSNISCESCELFAKQTWNVENYFLWKKKKKNEMKILECHLFQIFLCNKNLMLIFFIFPTGTIEEVRVLFYHIVVCGYMNVTSFLIPVISVWPEVLRREDG